mmetsp:Transcript_7296/g.8402  ORF Transcript_7296/g.8402 Transcript_7296/m.8402 type:complete len:93 (+) Transcript_7296:565-843(+)
MSKGVKKWRPLMTRALGYKGGRHSSKYLVRGKQRKAQSNPSIHTLQPKKRLPGSETKTIRGVFGTEISRMTQTFPLWCVERKGLCDAIQFRI